MASLEQIFWAFIIGVMIAAAYTFYTKKILGGFVRALLDADAFSEKTAVSFEDLGYKPNFFLKYSLRDGSAFSDTVKNCDGRYYIPEDKIEKAESKYKGESITILILLVAILAFAVVALLCIYLFPELVEMAEGLFTSEK